MTCQMQSYHVENSRPREAAGAEKQPAQRSRPSFSNGENNDLSSVAPQATRNAAKGLLTQALGPMASREIGGRCLLPSGTGYE
ncbi:hypothetical protein RRF57_001093 [Xylaria bambusicola]|uniref:Uncharacterized protein n=1 Tax=Xylaria bambusicola TaxID=326684 RepID=A0AAN7UDC4_9PEZI